MKERFSPDAASLGFISAYCAAVFWKLPLLTYLPVEGLWRLGRAQGSHPMYWYGFLATATLAGLAAGALAPRRESRLWASLPVWAGVAALLLLSVAELRWFR